MAAGLTFSSGAVDAVSYLALGKIFTAFMTGNLEFRGLRVVGEGQSNIVHARVSLAAFAAGVALSQQIVEAPGGSGVWPRRVSVVLAVEVVA